MAVYKKIKYYVPHMGRMLFIAFLCIIGASAILIAEYHQIYIFLEKILANLYFNKLTNVATILVLLGFGYTLIYFLALITAHLVAFRLETNLKKAGMDALLEAPFSFFDHHSSGSIRKILDDNTALTHMSVAHLLPDLAAAVFVPAFGLILASRVDLRLFVFMVLTIVIGGLLGKQMMGEQTFMDEYMKAQEAMGAHAVEYVRNMSVVKIFNADVKSMKNFYQSIADYSKKVLDYSMSCRIPYVTFQTFFNTAFLLLIPFAFYFLSRGEAPTAYLAKAVFYVLFCGIIFTAFMKIMYVGMHTYLASAAIGKIEALVDEMKKDRMESGTLSPAKRCSIDFEHVTFGYGEEKIFEDLSLHLDPGKTYALVGASGGGKSTLAKLIAGFYLPDSGSIKIDGAPLAAYSADARVDMISMVFQHARLFKTSIFENVKVGDPSATDEEVMRALRLARCEDILDKFDTRENTLIGAKGVHLSGGEMQRIAIARAILKDAPILILDEASAAADPENEYEIQQAFSNLMKDKTVIMIAHRLSSIKNADEILVLEKGAVVERGTHRALMELQGRYFTLQSLYQEANDWKVLA